MAEKGHELWNYIDDMYMAGSKDEAEVAFRDLCTIVVNLGLPINEDKLCEPTEVINIMGIEVDAGKKTLSIPLDKMEEIYSTCIQFSSKDSCTKREFQSLLGKLLYISRIIQPARSSAQKQCQCINYSTVKIISPRPGLVCSLHHGLQWQHLFWQLDKCP